jgi:hypothetical protein
MKSSFLATVDGEVYLLTESIPPHGKKERFTNWSMFRRMGLV